tara:strand:- start:252448 stop:253362 length:915 start_codon:yes stop_codon:yes gene_type:complete
MRQFPWDDLQYFLAVAQEGKLSSAARRLRTSHVTVARRIERLEQGIGAKLFQRSPKGYTLTPMGERLMEPAKAMALEADKMLGVVGDGTVPLSGVIRLSVPEGYGNFFIAEKLPQFASQHPNLTIEMVNIQQIVSLSRREADISVSLSVPKAGSYHSENISSYILYIYASRDYLARNRAIKQRSDLAGHPFIGYIEDMIFTPELNYLGEIIPGLRPSYQTSSVFAQLKACRAGYGLCVLPYYMGDMFDDLVAVLPKVIPIHRDYWLVCHNDMIDATRIRPLVDFIRRETTAAQDWFNGFPEQFV